jgi:hypothetical protein
MPLPESLCSTLFAAVSKRLLKEGWGLFAFCLWLLLWALEEFGGLILLLWAFCCGKLLEGKRITEGKRIAKEGLIESLHQELLT